MMYAINLRDIFYKCQLITMQNGTRENTDSPSLCSMTMNPSIA